MYQSLANGLVNAGWVALIALGFGIIYGPARFFHFAHGLVFATAPYLTYLFFVVLGLPLYVALSLGILLSTGIGCLMEVMLYRPSRKRRASHLTLLLVSLGLYVVGQNLISVAFGNDTKSYGFDIQRGNDLLGVFLTNVQIGVVVSSIVAVPLAFLILKRTGLGRSIRAVADNPTLANISGLDSQRVILWSFAIGSALAAIAGVMLSLDVGLTPSMGFNPLIMGVVAYIIGGTDKLAGIVGGALLVGLSQTIAIWILGPGWHDAIVFGIMFVFLIIYPQGILGTTSIRTSVR